MNAKTQKDPVEEVKKLQDQLKAIADEIELLENNFAALAEVHAKHIGTLKTDFGKTSRAFKKLMKEKFSF